MVVVKEVVVVVLSKMNGVMKELQQQVARKTSVASPTVFTQRPHTCSQRLPTCPLLPTCLLLLKAICLSFSFPQLGTLDCLRGIRHRDLRNCILSCFANKISG